MYLAIGVYTTICGGHVDASVRCNWFWESRRSRARAPAAAVSQILNKFHQTGVSTWPPQIVHVMQASCVSDRPTHDWLSANRKGRARAGLSISTLLARLRGYGTSIYDIGTIFAFFDPPPCLESVDLQSIIHATTLSHLLFVYRVTIQIVTNLPVDFKTKVPIYYEAHVLNCTKTQPLFWSQREVCHNLNGHPVHLSQCRRRIWMVPFQTWAAAMPFWPAWPDKYKNPFVCMIQQQFSQLAST